MDPVVTPFAQLMGLNDHLLGKALAGIKPDDLARRPGPNSNPLLWIVGHIVATRNLLARALGAGLDLPWAGKFAQKSAFDETAEYPEAAELEKILRQLSAQLQVRLTQLSDAELSARGPREFPIPDKTVRGTIAFLIYHEAYHVGQVGYLKKWLGYPGIVDG